MNSFETTEALEEAWLAMAEHFLDTETRHLFAKTAWACLRAGLTPSQAREHWRERVAPILSPNILSVAGEWAGWDEAWLVSAIRQRHAQRRTLLRRLQSWTWATLTRSESQVLANCMESLLARPEVEREELVRALTLVFRQAVDFTVPGEEPSSEQLRALGAEAYQLLRPTLSREARLEARQRLGRRD